MSWQLIQGVRPTSLVGNYGLRFNNDLYVTIPNATNYDFGGKDFSLLVFLLPLAAPTTSQRLLSKTAESDAPTDARQGYILNVDATYYNFYLRPKTGNDTIYSIPVSAIPIGRISLLVVERINQNGTMAAVNNAANYKFYVDGVEVAKTVTQASTLTVDPATNSGVFAIGATSSGTLCSGQCPW